jgi:hypothetical protein
MGKMICNWMNDLMMNLVELSPPLYMGEINIFHSLEVVATKNYSKSGYIVFYL